MHDVVTLFRHPSGREISFCRELEQPQLRWRSKRYKFAYFKIENGSFARFTRGLFSFDLSKFKA